MIIGDLRAQQLQRVPAAGGGRAGAGEGGCSEGERGRGGWGAADGSEVFCQWGPVSAAAAAGTSSGRDPAWDAKGGVQPHQQLSNEPVLFQGRNPRQEIEKSNTPVTPMFLRRATMNISTYDSTC